MSTPQEPPQPPANKHHTAKKGDTLSGMAQQYYKKQSDWPKIWNHPENRSIASKRGKPELIQPGDPFTIPPGDKEMQEYEAAKRKFEEEKLKEEEERKKAAAEALRIGMARLNLMATEMENSLSYARGHFDMAKTLNNDQYIVGWFLHNLPGTPDFPSEAPIKKAEDLIKQFRSAISAQQFNKLDAMIPETSKAINEANKMIRDYRSALIAGGERTITALEITRDVSFFTLGALATIATGGAAAPTLGSVATGAGVQMGVTAIKSLAEQYSNTGFSKGAANVVGTAAAEALVTGIVEFATAGLIKNPAFVGEATKKTAALLAASKGASRLKLTEAALEKLLTDFLKTSGKALLETALETACDLITGKTKKDEVVLKVATTIAAKIALGSLGDWLGGNFAKKSWEAVPKIKVSPLKGSKPITQKAFEDGMKKFLSDAYSKYGQTALENCLKKGTASNPEAIGKELVDLTVADPKFLAQWKKVQEDLQKVD